MRIDNPDYDNLFLTVYPRMMLVDEAGSQLTLPDGQVYITFEQQQFKWRHNTIISRPGCSSCGTRQELTRYAIDAFAHDCAFGKKLEFPFLVAYIELYASNGVETKRLDPAVTESFYDNFHKTYINRNLPSFLRPKDENREWFQNGQ